MNLPVEFAWKVYGSCHAPQEEAGLPSFTMDMDTPDNPWRRSISMEVYNSDITGCNDYSVIKITGLDEQSVRDEFTGQLYDGTYENYDIGTVLEIDPDDIHVNRSWIGQGYGFKSEKAFKDVDNPDNVCYMPECSKHLYSRNDFLKLADNNAKVAERIFSYCDWQTPEDALDELLKSQEIVECPKCKHLILLGDEEDATCEHCGTAIHIHWPY